MFRNIIDRIPWDRFKRGWAASWPQALGTGLPFITALVLWGAVEEFGAHLGVFFVGLMFVCQVEAWAFHSKNGSIDGRGPGGFWFFFSLFGLGFISMLMEMDMMPVVMRTLCGLSLYVLAIAFANFTTGFFAKEEKA